MLDLLAPSRLTDKGIYYGFALLTLLSSLAAVLLYTPIPLAVPLGCLAIIFAVNAPLKVFYLFFFLLPFSMEFEFGSFGTDLPSEPMMVSLLGLALLLLIKNVGRLRSSLFLHPIALMIITHVCWIGLTTITSTHPVISLKYFLAKIWYVVPFFFLPLILMKTELQFRRVFQVLSISMFVAIVFVLVKHAGFGFSFDKSNKVVRPIFRNHVNYAIMLLAFLPYFWYVIKTAAVSHRKWLYGLLLVLLLAIYFSFTRAAQASVILAVAYHWVLRWRLTKICVAVGLVGALFLSAYLVTGERYLEHAPDYEKTITHKKFNDIVGATTKMEDISTVERFFRWVAGGYMVAEKPVFGFGPATFYNNYNAYTVTSYTTYVSDNPERSGIHNNYLMVAVEQGLPGLLIMLAMAILPLLYAEQIYHRLEAPEHKRLLMAAATCFFVLCVVLLINDLIEADKVGPFFFLSAAAIVWCGDKVLPRDTITSSEEH